MSRIGRLLLQLTSPKTAILVLVVGLAYQALGLYHGVSIKGLPDTIDRLNQPAWERGARSALGDTFADYVAFVRSMTPESSSIVLPPHTIIQPYAEVGLMQFYFYPRKVYNCGPNEAEACMYRARTKHTYVLAVPHFPPPEQALKYKTYVRFSDKLGIYVPKDTSPEEGGN